MTTYSLLDCIFISFYFKEWLLKHFIDYIVFGPLSFTSLFSSFKQTLAACLQKRCFFVQVQEKSWLVVGGCLVPTHSCYIVVDSWFERTSQTLAYIRIRMIWSCYILGTECVQQLLCESVSAVYLKVFFLHLNDCFVYAQIHVPNPVLKHWWVHHKQNKTNDT